MRPGIDRTATGLRIGAIAARTASASLVLFWSLNAGLIALAADLMLSLATNLRLHHVVKHRTAVGSLDKTAPTIWRQWRTRHLTKVAAKADAKADRLLAQVSETQDDFTARDLRRKAEKQRRDAGVARSLMDD
ncbi:hypothetical protein [Candidatus Poriferisodalis sp.]|uniref:hypothetical protein n=1 Tax=Candidatus Poriferisodalis sp. TaxID=3101277 RepID=UPI003B5A6176